MSDELRAYWRRKYHARRAKLGLEGRPPGRPPKLSAEKAVMLVGELQNTSDKIIDLAQKYGVSEGTVRRYAIRRGVRRRPKERPSGGTFRPHPNLPWYEVGLPMPPDWNTVTNDSQN